MMEYFKFSLVMFGGNSVGTDHRGIHVVMKCGRTVKVMFITGNLIFCLRFSGR